MVREDPAAAGSFRTPAESGLLPRADPCLRHSLSVLRTYRDADHQRRLFRKLGEHVAKATLAPEHGRAKPTPTERAPSHTTWWPYPGVVREALFSMVRGEA